MANYVLGKGRIYFDKFADNVVVDENTVGEGERYIGNTPEFSTSSASESLDHFSAEGGIRTKDDSVQLSLDRTGRMTTDEISADNLSLLMLGDASSLIDAGATAEVEEFTVKQDRFYQLGASTANPSGARQVANVVVKNGVAFADTVAASGNYTVDAALGRIYIVDGSPDIDDDSEIQVTYDISASTRDIVISGTDSIYGSLRFVADNPKGLNRDFYLPYVKLSPDGDYALKGEEWQVIGFTFDILKKGSLESLYIDGRAVVTP